ncbi:hypothetical protein [Nocardiopsis sp. FR26]|uniref:hypothetical protein n=1 Tax=Nocardiopsis sp. FR26 TaxID=2605987 RepID=UPI00135CB8CB|nr:hypothetical protein [Nocardiopsis sp. FR26]
MAPTSSFVRRVTPRPAPPAVREPGLWLEPWRAYGLLAVMWAMSGGYSLALNWLGAGEGLYALLPSAGIILSVVILLFVARGSGATAVDVVGYWPLWPRTHPTTQWGQWWSVLAYATVALLAGNALYIAMHLTGGADVLDIELFFERVSLLHAVTVGAVVVLLSGAGRPVWEMYAVAVATTVASLIMPFGVKAVAAAVPAVCLVWLYRRTRRLSPLLLAELPALVLSLIILALVALAVGSPR